LRFAARTPIGAVSTNGEKRAIILIAAGRRKQIQADRQPSDRGGFFGTSASLARASAPSTHRVAEVRLIE
jgi:hypothetical protein